MKRVLDTPIAIFAGLITIGIFLFIGMIILGNLQGNSGFKAGSANANRADAVVGNFTSGISDAADNSGTWFVLAGIVILLVIVGLVMKSFGGGGFLGTNKSRSRSRSKSSSFTREPAMDDSY